MRSSEYNRLKRSAKEARKARIETGKAQSGPWIIGSRLRVWLYYYSGGKVRTSHQWINLTKEQRDACFSTG